MYSMGFNLYIVYIDQDCSMLWLRSILHNDDKEVLRYKVSASHNDLNDSQP